MESQRFWCYCCSSLTGVDNFTCSNCGSDFVEERDQEQVERINVIQESLGNLSSRLSRLMQVLQEITERTNSKAPASEETIQNLEWVSEQCECGICSETTFEKARKLPCNHVYHNECITKWLRMQSNCPMCRRHV